VAGDEGVGEETERRRDGETKAGEEESREQREENREKRTGRAVNRKLET
jgi:hypothetical protein